MDRFNPFNQRQHDATTGVPGSTPEYIVKKGESYTGSGSQIERGGVARLLPEEAERLANEKRAVEIAEIRKRLVQIDAEAQTGKMPSAEEVRRLNEQLLAKTKN